jgi:hypothetical protein
MQLMAQRRISFDHCTAHLRTVDPDYRIQDMTCRTTFVAFLFFSSFLHDLSDAGIFSLHYIRICTVLSHFH